MAVIRSTSRSALAGLVVVGGLALAGCAAGQVAQTARERPSVDGQQAQLGPIAIRDAALEYPQSGVYEQGSDARLRMVVANTGDSNDTLTSVTSNLAQSVTITEGTSGSATGSPAGASGSATGSPAGASGGSAPASGSATFSPSPTPSGTASGTPTGQAEPQSSVSAGSGAPSQTPSGSASGSASASPVGAPAAGASPTPTGGAAGEQKARITIPANGYVSFAENGPSVVLSGLSQKLYPAQNVSVTLTFQNAGSVTMTIPVSTPEGQISPAPTVSVTPDSESEG